MQLGRAQRVLDRPGDLGLPQGADPSEDFQRIGTGQQLIGDRDALVAEQRAEFLGDALGQVSGEDGAHRAVEVEQGEAVGLRPENLRGDEVDVHWKLYELNGRFYQGRPKDGSMRTVDVPPFLRTLLAGHLDASDNRKCTCRYAPPTGDRIPWCTGDEYVFLSPNQSHFRRSNYSVRVMRPAADGWHPGHAGRAPRPTMPVLVDMGDGWPGKPLPPQPPVVPGQPYTPRTGRGIRRVRDDETVASWLPILPGLTPHGLRHGHQTWMDEVNTSYVLQSERMGHEVPGMRGIYSHITPRMRGRLMEDFQEMWELSLTQRAKLSTRSAVGALNGLLASRGSRPTIIL